MTLNDNLDKYLELDQNIHVECLNVAVLRGIYEYTNMYTYIYISVECLNAAVPRGILLYLFILFNAYMVNFIYVYIYICMYICI
jgi:tRNA G18 (ribose-2'-O)-methylase SpoU